MSNLCLENVQFLNETALDGLDFILDEFSNEYNYLQNIDEVSISDSINVAINKLKELWKSFVESIKDTIRRIRIKTLQLLSKLKNKNRNGGKYNKSTNDIKLLPAKSKTTENEESVLKEKEKERRERREGNNSNNNEIIDLYPVPKEMVFTGYNKFITSNIITTICSNLVSHISHNGISQCLYYVKNGNEDNDKYENIFKGKYEILYKISDTLGKNDIDERNNTSIKDIIHQLIFGDECEVKAIFNDNNGYRIDSTINSMINNLSDFEKAIDGVDHTFNIFFKEDIDEKMSRHNDIYNRQLISEVGLVMRTAKDTISELLNCQIIILKLFFRCCTIGCGEYSYKYVKFKKA